MKCTVTSAIVFAVLSLIYGSAFAGNTQGLKYFNASLYIAFRMLFGALICLIILIVRIIINPREFLTVVKAHFTSGIVNILWMLLGGLLFHGVPQCIIAFSQKWVNSASVQLAQPISTFTGAISAHFVLPEEPFTWVKFWSLVLALIGVAVPAIPQFRRTDSSESGESIGDLALGYVLMILGTMCFGIAGTIMKRKTPNVDITVSSLIQITSSSIVCFIVSLAWDKPSLIAKQCSEAPPIAWVWPLIVGVLGTGIAGHGFQYLVQNLGATGSSFITVGQVTVGVILGVAALGDWNGYKWWEIFISVLGLICLLLSIVIEFALSKKETEELKKEENSEKGEEDLEDIETKKMHKEKEEAGIVDQIDDQQKEYQYVEGVDDKAHEKIAEL